MRPSLLVPIALAHSVSSSEPAESAQNWYPPAKSWINDLDSVINSTGVHGFIFNSSDLPPGSKYGTYNWCNMPHVRRDIYPAFNSTYGLEYVEVIHRHHKRTPYASNTFPGEPYPWFCDDEGLFYYGESLNPPSEPATPVYWSSYRSAINPFTVPGFSGTCQFPQTTRGGLSDSLQHGRDLWDVYHSLLGFLPANPSSEQVTYRVTNNIITSQVAGMLVSGMASNLSTRGTRVQPLLILPSSVDSLEPSYTCPGATALAAAYGVGSSNPNWTLHLHASSALFADLDALSGVPANDTAWHTSWDHYFDNLSARQCHGLPLPCSLTASSTTTNHSTCITQAQADAVYRLGQYEYDYLYRSAPASLDLAVGSFGVWIAELVAHIRERVEAGGSVRYRHNVAHDGSLARLLAILQLDRMVWPGMGAEVVFEVFRDRRGGRFVRVLWGGRVAVSSHPLLDRLDMLGLDVLLGYLEGLVGEGAERVVRFCGE